MTNESIVTPWRTYYADYYGSGEVDSDLLSVCTASTAGSSTFSIDSPRGSLKAQLRYTQIDECRDGEVSTRKKEAKKGNNLRSRSRARSALKSVGQSFRSRSPFRTSNKITKSVEKVPETKDVTEISSKQEKLRSRTRSPLRQATKSITKSVKKASGRKHKGDFASIMSQRKDSIRFGPMDQAEDASVNTTASAEASLSSISVCSTSGSSDSESSMSQGHERMLPSILLKIEKGYDEVEEFAEVSPAYEVSLSDSHRVEVKETLTSESYKPDKKRKNSRRPQSSRRSTTTSNSGLHRRTSTRSIISSLCAGSGASDAVKRLREHQSGLVDRSLYFQKKRGDKLSFTRIAGELVPDYASYVEMNVAEFRKRMGVTDKDYKAVKEGLIGWMR